ncbi:hypothetical protein MTO96_038146, partial [Rhipicephalus appendiculatus]
GGQELKPNAPSNCLFYTCQKYCGGVRTHWYYNWFYKACFMSDSSHCGVGKNNFNSCEDCMKKCNDSVCVERMTTTHAPYDDTLWEAG